MEVATLVEISPGSMVPIADAAALPDDFYVEGALLLMVDDRWVMGADLADDVLSLWCQLGTLVTSYLADGRAMTMFPDQPIELRLDPADRPDVVRWSLANLPDPTTTDMDLVQLVEALADGARHFFREMTRLRTEDADFFREEGARWPDLVEAAHARRAT